MKKLLIKFIITAMVLSFFPNLGHANSLSNQDINQEEILIDSSLEQEIDSSIEEETDIDIEEELNLEVEDTNEEIIVTSELETEEFEVEADVYLDTDTEEIEVLGTFTDEYGETTDVNFNVTVIESDEEKFKAIFIDKETGEEIKYDSTEISASILPAVGVVVAFIARWGVQKAIQHFGKKALKEVAKKITKSDSPVWKGFNTYKGKTKTTGSGKKKRYYEWDHTHNDIEVYDHKGVHLGSMDPLTGEMYKAAVKGRSIKL
ncbi:cytotoxin [Bacillus sp. Y1]|nr:SAR2788 family putative toxin [Bacillus sp. Y1]AYA78105.1 cytotoxin [Bacillus sp. Y1]